MRLIYTLIKLFQQHLFCTFPVRFQHLFVSFSDHNLHLKTLSLVINPEGDRNSIITQVSCGMNVSRLEQQACIKIIILCFLLSLRRRFINSSLWRLLNSSFSPYLGSYIRLRILLLLLMLIIPREMTCSEP